MVAFILQGIGPDGPLDVLVLAGRVALSGTLIAAIYTAISMAASSLTDRRALASAATLLTIIGTGAVTGVLVEGVGLPHWIFAFHLAGAPFELVQRIYGERAQDDDFVAVHTAVLTVVNLGWIVAGGTIVWLRYRRIQVSR
jgi:ABC-2 type transport system permease protein